MVLKISRKIFLLVGAGITLLIVLLLLVLHFSNAGAPDMVAGGKMHPVSYPDMQAQTAFSRQEEKLSERFRRPSKEVPSLNKYSFNDFVKQDDTPPLITKKFDTPEDVILAYYGILRSASNMEGYSGGCGSIGNAKQPYPYAYELFTPESRGKMGLTAFTDSFKGIGYITHLKLYPAYAPPETPQDIQYYMVEIEVITGKKEDGANHAYKQEISYFAYYYGIVTVEKTPADGYKIQQIDYLPEEFLCAPEHGWVYDSDAVTRLIYMESLKIIDKIERTEQKDGMIYIYAAGNGQQYRLDFVRLTNGHDILLHENILENGQWKETDLLTEDWSSLKLSVLTIAK